MSKIVEMYERRISEGDITLEEVPKLWRDKISIRCGEEVAPSEFSVTLAIDKVDQQGKEIDGLQKAVLLLQEAILNK